MDGFAVLWPVRRYGRLRNRNYASDKLTVRWAKKEFRFANVYRKCISSAVPLSLLSRSFYLLYSLAKCVVESSDNRLFIFIYISLPYVSLISDDIFTCFTSAPFARRLCINRVSDRFSESYLSFRPLSYGYPRAYFYFLFTFISI